MAARALDITFPHPIDADHEDVRCALTVAAASWRRGHLADAAKWLRRAAKAAAEADDVMRAVELSKAAAELGPLEEDSTDGDGQSGERPSGRRSSRPPALPSSRPPVRRSGFAPKRPAAKRSPPKTPRPRPSAPPLRSRPAPSLPCTSPPSRAQASRPSAADRTTRRRGASDMAVTKPRMRVCDPPIPPAPPAPQLDLPSLIDDEEDTPTVIRRPTPPPGVQQPEPSQPIALELRAADRSGSYPSRPDLIESFDEDTIRSRGQLHPPVRRPEPSGIPLSAARVAVVADRRGGKPDIFFLPFGAMPPEGAVTAMLVTTNARDAAKLAELMTAATK